MPKNAPLLIDLGQGLSVIAGIPILSSWNTKGRPEKPKIGTFGFNFETNNLEYWNGKIWLKAHMSEDE